VSEARDHEDVEPNIVEVRRDGPLAAIVGVAAAGLAIAYLARAAGSGHWLDWLLMGTLGGVAGAYLISFLDARAPLLLADGHGIRMRTGRSWRGVAWTEVDRVEHLPRRGLLSDGRIVVVTGRDKPLTQRLSLATRLIGSDWDELTEALRDLAGEESDVVEPAPPTDETDDRPEAGPPADAAPDENDVRQDLPEDRAPSPLRRLPTPSNDTPPRPCR
jgi:cytoskeleton protein RodZ